MATWQKSKAVAELQNSEELEQYLENRLDGISHLRCGLLLAGNRTKKSRSGGFCSEKTSSGGAAPKSGCAG